MSLSLQCIDDDEESDCVIFNVDFRSGISARNFEVVRS